MSKKLIIYSIFVLVVFNIFCYWIIYNYFNLNDEVDFLNVGQGDSELIRGRMGNILIDTGPNEQVLYEISKVLPFYDKTIDLVILSHPNTDHFNGLFYLLEHYKIRAVIVNNIEYPATRYQQLLEKLKDNNVIFIQGELGTNVKWLNNSILILSPPTNFNTNNINKLSLVSFLSLQNQKFLFTGDIDTSIEKKLISLISTPINVLKVAHHGSNTASSQEFLNIIQPQVGIIEVGENNYNQPHPDILKRFNERGIKIFRTDLDGMIKCIVKNDQLLITKENI